MYTLFQIKEILLEKNYFIDEATVKQFFKNWRIEAIYENEEGQEYFDDMALKNILKGMELKSQGQNDNDIVIALSKSQDASKENLPQKVETTPIEESIENIEPQKISLDISSRTLSFLAETMAQKITQDVTNHITESGMITNLEQTAVLKRDNEAMAKQISTLMEENKKLIKKISALAMENEKYKHVFGKFYLRDER
jgi:hypothetical protein